MGTDFSRLDMVRFQVVEAMRGRAPVAQLFASDNAPAAQAFMRTNHPGVPLYCSVASRPVPATRLHLYAAGPPCQPWAPGGRRRGLDDERAALFFSRPCGSCISTARWPSS